MAKTSGYSDFSIARIIIHHVTTWSLDQKKPAGYLFYDPLITNVMSSFFQILFKKLKSYSLVWLINKLMLA